MTTATPVLQPAAANRGSNRQPPLWLAVVFSGVGGLLNALAFPGTGWWPLAFIGTPLILGALLHRRFAAALMVGLIGGVTFWGVLIFWLTVYLGPVPWLALVALEAVFFAFGCALIALAWRATDHVVTSRLGRLAIAPILVAALWTLREYVASTWPYGGFSWGRLGFSQSESPFGELLPWVGASGLTFLIAFAGALTVQSLRSSKQYSRRTRFLVPALTFAGLLAVPAFPIVESGTMRIAAVQGASDAGLFARTTPGQILEDHVYATEPLFGRDVDLLVWPENASDVNPLGDEDAAATLDRVGQRVDAPMVVGTLTTSGKETFNSLLLWQTGNGATAQYDKMHPVPFAEYLPDRDFWFPLAPDLFSLIPRDFSIGTRENVFDIDGVLAGLAICFDIVDDGLVRTMVANGAEVILAPTNNADFGQTAQSVQQLVIARTRALEAGRSVVNISTVGSSAIIGPDGTALDSLETFTPGAMLEDVPLSDTLTPAMSIGPAIEFGMNTLGIVGAIISAVVTWRRRSNPR